MASYKLTYFDARARGEPARMLLALKGQKYEDVRYTYGGDEWPKIKGDKARFPFGTLPVLEIDGRIMTQSRAIWRYLAKEFGYFGNNTQEAADIDVICEVIGDVEIVLTPTFDEQDSAKRDADLIKAKDTTLKPFLDFFSESIQKAEGKFIVGNKISLADLVVYNIIDFFVDSVLTVKGYLDSYPHLLKFYKAIKEDSPLTPYLKSRPVTVY